MVLGDTEGVTPEGGGAIEVQQQQVASTPPQPRTIEGRLGESSDRPVRAQPGREVKQPAWFTDYQM